MTDEEIRNLWRTHDDVIDFARAIEQLVREEDAKICEDEAVQLRDAGMFDYGLVAIDCAEAIRAGGRWNERTTRIIEIG